MKGKHTGAGIKKIPMRKEDNKTYDAVEVGNRIRTLRNNKGISQECLAKIFGSKTDTIRKYENGERPIPSDRLALLIETLDKSADYILYGDQKQNDIEQLIEQINCLEASIKSLEKLIIENLS